MTPSRGIAYLESLVGWDGGGRFDLERPWAIMARLGNPQDKIPSIHVTGTNGKGTVAALLAAMFHAAGKKTAQFCSPHLTDVTERCLIDGRPVEAALFDQAIEQARAAADAAGCSPSHFELATAASFAAAELAGAEMVVAEVGLGGELDATNVIKKPLAAVITTVGLDHVNILGGTIAEIAAVKAGIIKPGSPVVCGDIAAPALEAIEARANERRSGAVYRWGREYRLSAPDAVEVLGRTIRFGPGAQRFCAGYQLHNMAVAAAAAAVCGLNGQEISRGISIARWPGRLEIVRPEESGLACPILLDVAHNRDGILALLAHLSAVSAETDSLTFVVSILDRKEWQVMLEMIRSWVQQAGKPVEMIFTRSDDPHAVDPAELAKAYGSGEVVPEPGTALKRAELMAKARGGRALITVSGSLFLVSKIRPQLTAGPFRSICWDQD